MIQPDGMHAARARRAPAPASRDRRLRPGACSAMGLLERPAAVARPCRLDLRGGSSSRPQHDDLRQRRSAARSKRHARRHLAVEAPFAGHRVDLYRGPECRPAIAADCDEDVGFAVGGCAPRHGDDRAGGGDRRRRVGAAGNIGKRCRLQAPVAGAANCDGADERRKSDERAKSSHHRSGQKRRRAPNWNDRGSPTAVIWPKVGEGLVGYAPAPKLVLRVSDILTIGQVEDFGQRFELRRGRRRGRCG